MSITKATLNRRRRMTIQVDLPSEEEEELPIDEQYDHVDLEEEYERYQADVAGQSDGNNRRRN